MTVKKSTLFLLLTALLHYTPPIQAQEPNKQKTNELDDLSSMLDEEDNNENKTTHYTTGTFKTTRIANGHSTENLGKGLLDFRVNHRFGTIKSGFEEFFGLDNATTRIGFDYGITDWLMVGIGRSTFLSEFDGFVKAKILRQTDDDKMPITLSYVGALSYQKNDFTMPAGKTFPKVNRLAYINQILIARKFGSAFSLQLMPTHIHYNMVNYKDDPNDVLGMGIGARLKLSKRLSLTGEYYYMIPGQKLRDMRNALTIGLDIETGGHVFQLLFTNAPGITERTVIGENMGNWGKGEIHFGFNISRVFTVVKPKGFENSRNKVW
jgi:hypothetical protein